MNNYQEIEGFPNYEVSTSGDIRNKKTNRMITPAITKGYKQVCLYTSKGGRACFTMHNLIAKIFLPNPENKSTVICIDGDKSNTCIDNLRWATTTENKRQSMRHGKEKVIEISAKELEDAEALLGRGFHKLAVCHRLGINLKSI